MGRDGRRSDASPSWPWGILGWGRGALRIVFKRKPIALWRSWEKPMVGKSMLYYSELSRLLSSPGTPLKTFQGQPYLSCGSLFSTLPWIREKERREPRGLLCIYACCVCTPMRVHIVWIKGHLILFCFEIFVFRSLGHEDRRFWVSFFCVC